MMLAEEVHFPTKSHLFVWGSHKDGKLGFGTDISQDALVPTVLPLSQVMEISCGCDHSVAMDSK